MDAGRNGSKDRISTPALPRLILGCFLPEYNRASVLGDLEEEFAAIAGGSGRGAAARWYTRQALRSIIPGIRHSLFFHSSLLSNYLRISVRTLGRHRAYSIINIAGLAVGLGVFLFFAVLAGEDLHADFFHAKGERIFGVVQV
ncbi:MAG TPA: hypothetical protein VLA34_06495, partial [Candidatus Krumholzibacterium sp.]|nr:hypothetical protein [Candidatus Krumholzibacterium sp.]